MATCHPHVISVFCIRLVLNSITNNSQLRPWWKERSKHDQLNLSFWRLFHHFCKYILASYYPFKAVKQMFTVFLIKFPCFNNFDLS